ncbi:hypothetical protein BUE80_DR013606 [Diplocarpon rosae]|nr:hypothetical protein BUE80_DR013606 [Diplocarpon rosae]
MANPYEVEHNIKPSPRARTRRPDMSSFFNQLSQIEVSRSPNNAHAVPTPVEVAAADRLVQEQYRALLASAPRSSAENAALLERTCPLDRKVLLKKKEVPKMEVEEDEDYDEMFA